MEKCERTQLAAFAGACALGCLLIAAMAFSTGLEVVAWVAVGGGVFQGLVCGAYIAERRGLDR